VNDGVPGQDLPVLAPVYIFCILFFLFPPP
jgi:hypothetical protein